MKARIIKVIILVLFISATKIQAQRFSLNSNFIFNLSKAKYSSYYGFSASGQFSVIKDNIYLGPYLTVFTTKIPYWVENLPESAYNRAFVLGVKSNFYPIKSKSVFCCEYQPFFGVGFGYQFNYISSTSNMPYNFENDIFFIKLENDFVTDLYMGIIVFSKPNFFQFFAEFSYQFRNPKLSYNSDTRGVTTYHETQIDLSAVFLNIGFRWVFE